MSKGRHWTAFPLDAWRLFKEILEKGEVSLTFDKFADALRIKAGMCSFARGILKDGDKAVHGVCRLEHLCGLAELEEEVLSRTYELTNRALERARDFGTECCQKDGKWIVVFESRENGRMARLIRDAMNWKSEEEKIAEVEQSFLSDEKGE